MNNIRKYIFVFSLAVFFLFPYKVAAEDVKFEICNDGFWYVIEAERSLSASAAFYDENLHLSYNSNYTNEPNWVRVNFGDMTFKYTSIGTWGNGGDSKQSMRCYVLKTTENNVDTYTSKLCGEKYDLGDLDFKNNPNPSDSDYKEQTIESDGKVTIKIHASNNVAQDFSRLKISYRNYPGSLGNISYDYDNKDIIISGISPSKDGEEASYKIGFYIDGIKTEDFNGISGDINSYVNSCGGANGGYYLGELSVAIIPESKVKVNKPSYVDSLCSELSGIAGISNVMKEALVPECNSNHVFYYNQLSNLKSTIIDKINNLKTLSENYRDVSGLSDKDNVLCTDTDLGLPSRGNYSAKPFETKVTYENYGTYFGMVCTESYYVDAGVPSLVKPGMGVEYSNAVEIRKSCSITQISQVTRKQQCRVNVSQAVCPHHSASRGDYTLENGGPTSDFDQCVTDCDGGSYTQSCINSCYKSIYDDERSNQLTLSTSLITRNNSDRLNSGITKVENGTDAASSCSITWNGYGDFEYSNVCGGLNVSVNVDANQFYHSDTYNKFGRATLSVNGEEIFTNGYSSYCNAHGNSCTVTISKGPAGCSDNPETEYQAALARARSELTSYETLAKEVSGIENYTIAFTDSKTGDVYELSGSTNDISTNPDEPRLQITKDEENSSIYRNITTNYTLGSTGVTQSGISEYSTSTVYDIKLPTVYSKTDDADIIAIKGNNANTYYTYKSDKVTKRDDGIEYYNFARLSDYYPRVTFNEALFSDGKQVYYTNLYSSDTNVAINDKRYNNVLSKLDHAIVTINDKTYTYVLVNNISNIKVEMQISQVNESAGFSKFKVADNISCYYGVYKITRQSNTDSGGGGGDDPNDGDDASGGSTSTIPSGGSSTSNQSSGLRYYYREIDLTDVFPNGRKPRWNWTGTITTSANGSSSTTGASNNENPAYLVDPTKLIQSIESKGNSIFTNTNEDDYSYTLTISQINTIRAYNKSKIDGKRITYLDFSLAGNTLRNTYSKKIKEWLPNLDTTNITECNNAYNNTCDNEWRLSYE